MKQKFTMPDGEIREHEQMPVWKTPYNHDTNFESDRYALYTPEESRTKQEFKEDTDINVILDRFRRNAGEPPIILPEHFADTTTATSYYAMASKAAEANATFYQLPPEIRADHLNDPARWADEVVKALQLEDRDKLNKLGIATIERPQEPAQGDPPATGSPAGQTAQAAPAGQAGAQPLQPQSDTGKK